MMNGQAKLADRERMERLAKATGRSQWDLQDDMDQRALAARRFAPPRVGPRSRRERSVGRIRRAKFVRRRGRFLSPVAFPE